MKPVKKCLGATLCLVVLTSLAVATTAKASDCNVATETSPQFGVAVVSNVMVPMRDGVKLATDIYFPATNDGQILPGRWPTVLERTPYNKTSFLANAPNGNYYAQRGYVYVGQDVRGRYASEGVFAPYVNDGPDGFDTMKWIYQQIWSNKKIAVTGSSYFASTAQAILAERAPGLAAAIIRAGAGNYHEDGAWHGGTFLLTHNVNYTLSLAAVGKEAQADPSVHQSFVVAEQPPNEFQLMKESPLSPGSYPFGLAPSYDSWYQEWQKYELYGPFWHINGNNFTDYYWQSADVPVLLLDEWYDQFLGGMLDGFVGYNQFHRSPVHMVISGGEHLNIYQATQTWVGDVDMGNGLPIPVPALMLQWFDHFLKGVDNGVKEDNSFCSFRIEGVTGTKNAAGRLQAGGSWQKFSAWPPKDMRPTAFYLTPHRDLKIEPPAHGTLSYYYDPSNPVPTVGASVSSGAGVVMPGPYDQVCSPVHLACGAETGPLNSRPDVLSFTTAPLKADLEVTGPISVYLWVSSSAKDTDFTAKLIDQYPPTADYPNGYAMMLSDSIVRARFRSFTRSGEDYRRLYAIRNEPLIPGEIYEIVIDLWSRSNLFRAGHQIRLDISSSNFPMYDANPNTGKPFVQRDTQMPTAHNTIFLGYEHPSRIVLPIRGERE